MTPRGDGWETGGPSDDDLLARIATAVAAQDPMPERLVERVVLAVAMDELHLEVARIVHAAPVPADVVRGGDVEEIRTITFSADSMTIMVSVGPGGRRGVVRIDGWVAPVGKIVMAVRLPGETRHCPVDDTGRFTFVEVPRGTVQFEVGPGTGRAGPRVRTPSVRL